MTNLLAFSGKKRVGKDLCTKIVQYLIAKNNGNLENTGYNILFDEFINKAWNEEMLSGWKNVKFSDKLKDIVCLLTGCTREQLEDEEFKNSKLPKEWEIDRQKYNFDYNYTPDYREFLQTLGTNLLRNRFHPNIWINATMIGYVSEEDLNTEYARAYPNNMLPLSKWIISDVRFPNECKAIKDREGIIIRINRASLKSTDTHESEVALDNFKNWDYIIENDNDIPSLIKKVKIILEKEGII